jgi:choline kinase
VILVNTKAVILAAGRGTRLFPLTKDMPKTLLKVTGKPILEYILDRLANIGIAEIIIVVGHFGEKIKRHVGTDYRGIPVRYVFNPIYDKTNSTYSLWLTRDIAGDDFLVINADTLFSRDIIKYLVDSDHEIALSIDDTLIGELPEEAMKVTIVDGLIKDVSKKIVPEKTHGDAIGVYRFKGKGVKVLYDELKRLVDGKILDHLFTFAVRSLMDTFDVYSVSTRGLSWVEVDDPNDLKKAKKIVENMLKEEE